MVVIASINVRGLQNNSKRDEMFLYVKKLQYDIIFMQETHSTEKDELLWSNKWGGKILYSHCDSKSKGTAILFNPSLQCKIFKTTTDTEGRYVICDCEIQGAKLLLVNIYAPNADEPEFFFKVFNEMGTHNHANRIVGGDFNLVLDENVDSCNRKNNNSKAQKSLLALSEESMLIDTWRHLNPKSFQFTWHRRKPDVYARLDYIMVNYNLISSVKSCKHIPSYKTDHNTVLLEIECNSTFRRGPGFWKLNESILNDLNNLNRLNNKVDETINKTKFTEKCLRWELLKDVIVKECKEISSQRAKKSKEIILKLQNTLQNAEMRAQTAQTDLEKNIADEAVNECKIQMSRYVQSKADGARIRCRTRWYEDAEKSTKYFFGLEKVKYQNKTLTALRLDDNSITRNEKKILGEQSKFYKKLYSKNPKIKFAMENTTETKYDEEDAKQIGTEFTYDDFTKAARSIKRGKAPGNDGLTIAVYIVLWAKIGTIIWDAMVQSKQNGFLYRSARRGVVSLIPKKTRDPLNIKSWRPLMLLNTCHKILTKMLSNRIKGYLYKVIGEQQTGYVPGRFIGLSLRKMIDIIAFLEKEETPALLLQVDYLKCFDTVEHDSMYAALCYFHMPEYIIDWIKVVYERFEFCVINNGRWSQYYTQSRGVHQGCALSGPLFLYVAEILAINIKKNDKIKGINIMNENEKLEQYADDTSIWSIYCENSMNEIIEELDQFYENTGLKVNYEKSVIYKVACPPNSKRLYLKKKFAWGKNAISALGIITGLSAKDGTEDANFEEILEKVSKTLEIWKRRSLSLVGKTQVINSLINSMFVYKMQVLPCISSNLEGKINVLVNKFIWNGRKPKLKLDVLYANTADGGLKLANLRLRDTCLKIEWVRRLHDPNGDTVITKLAYHFINTRITSELFWQCNFSKEDCKIFAKDSLFWKSVVQSWAQYNFDSPNTDTEVVNQILWYNSYIKIQGNLVFWQDWFEKGVIYLKDIIIEDKLMTKIQIETLYDLIIPVMRYNQIISAIPNEWKNMINSTACENEGTSNYEYLVEKPKWSRIVYKKLNQSDKHIIKCMQTWSRKMNCTIDLDEIRESFMNIGKYATVTKYKAFQYRLLHNVIFLNDKLAHLGIAASNKCDNCETNNKEDVLHFFVECTNAKKIWYQILLYIQRNIDCLIKKLEAKDIILNVIGENPFGAANLLVCITKQKMYTHKCLKKKLRVQEIIQEYEFIHKMEHSKAISTCTTKNYNARWPDKIDNREIC